MSNHPALVYAANAAEAFLAAGSEIGIDLQEASRLADMLAHALRQPSCPTPWEWFTMGHPDIVRIKATGQRIMVWVPRKVLPKGAAGQHLAVHPPKLAFAHWVTTLADTPAARSSRHAQALLEKHGGFWAADKRGIKPVKGEPQLWAYLPVTE